MKFILVVILIAVSGKSVKCDCAKVITSSVTCTTALFTASLIQQEATIFSFNPTNPTAFTDWLATFPSTLTGLASTPDLCATAFNNFATGAATFARGLTVTDPNYAALSTLATRAQDICGP